MEEQLPVSDETKEAIQAEIQSNAQKRAEKTIRKESREITRLKKLAGDAVLGNNKPSYLYAMAKLRTIYMQPTTPDLLEALWESSRKTVWNILNQGA